MSAPNPKTAASLSNFKSLLTNTAVEAFISIVASPSILNTPLLLCCTKLAASPKVNLFVLLSVRPVPSVCVNVVSLSAPKLNTTLSDNNLKSSPIDTSAATPKPPPTVNAPSVVEVFAVVAVIDTTPPEDIDIAFVSDAEPMFAPSAIIIFVCVVSPPEVCTVPVSLGNVIVLSAVGSTTVNVVSKPSSVAPSNTIVPSSFTFIMVEFKVVEFKVV